MSTTYGTVVVAGRMYPVTSLSLRDGRLRITAQRHAESDQPAIRDQPAAVFGVDGQGVCQSWKVSIPAVHAGEMVTIILPLVITQLEVPGE